MARAIASHHWPHHAADQGVRRAGRDAQLERDHVPENGGQQRRVDDGQRDGTLGHHLVPDGLGHSHAEEERADAIGDGRHPQRQAGTHGARRDDRRHHV